MKFTIKVCKKIKWSKMILYRWRWLKRLYLVAIHFNHGNMMLKRRLFIAEKNKRFVQPILGYI
ncbi:hypothetical protein NCCP28_03430 [Niallia sp. NCCP-28]|nr:hypothetical protein NCCP28_03430 [Niallia sp. NCCP-28]